jgi:hypothetical protein
MARTLQCLSFLQDGKEICSYIKENEAVGHAKALVERLENPIKESIVIYSYQASKEV